MGEADGHRGSLAAAIRVGPESASEVFDERLDHEQTQARAAPGSDVLMVDAVETIEDPPQLALGDADAVVADADPSSSPERRVL